jgi:hypothetical protein
MAKQRQVRIEQGLSPALMEEMQERSTEQLEAETKHRSIALSILGSRAAERYDAEATRTYFRRALAASRPQERPQIRRMANASLALAEHRAGDLKVAVEKLGHEAPPKRALMGLRLMGLIAPPKGAPTMRRVRGIAVVALIVIILLLIGLALVELISLPFGGVGLPSGILLGFLLVIAILSILALFGRRRQKAAQAKAKAARARPAGAPVATAKTPSTIGRRLRGAQAKPAAPAAKSSASAGRGAAAEGRTRGAEPTKASGDGPKTTGSTRTKPASRAAPKQNGPARAKPAGSGRPKPAAPSAKPAGAKPASVKPAPSKPGTKSGGTPAGQGTKPSRRTRGSGTAK